MKKIERIAIIGLESIGAMYARQISLYAPEITLFGVVRDIQVFWGSPVIINDSKLRINYRTFENLTGISIDVILLCIRAYQLHEMINAITPLVGPHTVIISLTETFQTENVLIQHFGATHVLRSSLNSAVFRQNGRYITVTSQGTLHLELASAASDMNKWSTALCELFVRCKISCKTSSDIRLNQWRQLFLFVGYEETSLVLQLSNDDFLQNEHAMQTMEDVQRELMQLGNSCGIPLNESDIMRTRHFLRSLPADGYSPMLQDYWANRRIDTEELGRDLCSLGEKQGIAMPANQWLNNEVSAMIRRRGDLPTAGMEIRGLNLRKGYTATPEKIANQLRIDIMQSKFPSGYHLAENELSARFEASRSSVRTALQILSNEGLLHTRPNGHRTVLPFSEKQMSDLYDLRWLLEDKALSLLFEQGQTVYPLLTETLSMIESKYRSQSIYAEIDDLDILFHRNLIRSADNVFLTNAYNGLVQLLYAAAGLKRFIRQENLYTMEFFAKHKHIYELILSRDHAAFPELKRHIEEEKEASVLLIQTFSG